MGQSSDLKKAELIEGVVYVAASFGPAHSYLCARMIGLLDQYAEATSGVIAGNGATFLISSVSAPQPDAFLRFTRGGGSSDQAKLFTGAPELIVEICDSSKARDLGPKKALYQKSNVREYVTVEVDPFRVTWRALNDQGEYEAIPPSEDGSIRSRAFPGLWLDVGALERGEPLGPTLRKGMRSHAYKSFRASLSKR